MFKLILPKVLFKVEKWKWNKEYRVYVSSQGHFKNEYKQNIPIKINNKGYVHIKTNCGYKSAHRLVMLTWAPIPNAEEMTVDHLDHNKRNNTLENLEWVSHKENLRRANEDLVEFNIRMCYLTNGEKVFSDYLEAAEWLIDNKKINCSVKKIATRLKNIIKQSPTGKYYGYTWKVKNLKQGGVCYGIKRYYC